MADESRRNPRRDLRTLYGRVLGAVTDDRRDNMEAFGKLPIGQGLFVLAQVMYLGTRGALELLSSIDAKLGILVAGMVESDSDGPPSANADAPAPAAAKPRSAKPWEVVCPKCGAEAEDPCLYAGFPAEEFHPERIRLARGDGAPVEGAPAPTPASQVPDSAPSPAPPPPVAPAVAPATPPPAPRAAPAPKSRRPKAEAAAELLDAEGKPV